MPVKNFASEVINGSGMSDNMVSEHSRRRARAEAKLSEMNVAANATALLLNKNSSGKIKVLKTHVSQSNTNKAEGENLRSRSNKDIMDEPRAQYRSRQNKISSSLSQGERHPEVHAELVESEDRDLPRHQSRIEDLKGTLVNGE